MRALDLFDGCGGMAHALTGLGYDVVGVENWHPAVMTSRAAGHRVIEADVRTLAPWALGHCDHFHASPPCTTFSAAGKGTGRGHLDELREAVKRVMHGEPHGLTDPDETTLLTLEPARFLAELRPATISFEQVRAVLPVWQAYADALGDFGYSAWAGLISAETLGVPQTRVRAWLGARCDGHEARPPVATHSAYYSREPQRLDDGVLPWVSMATALGWGGDLVHGFPRRADTADVATVDGVDYRARDLRSCDHPAFVLTEKARSWIVATGQVMRGGVHQERPIASPSPSLRQQTQSWRLTETDSRRYRNLTIDEALVLQGFPADYPLTGTRTAQFKQVGNAVPPPVGRAVVEALLR